MYEIAAASVAIPAPVTLPAVVTTAAAFAVIIAGAIDCNPAELPMIQEAYADLNKIVSSTAFEQQVINSAFTETNGMTSQQIYDLIVSSSPITVGFTMFTGSFIQNHITDTMGYEDPAHPGICFANRHFIQSKEVCGSLILHETMHVIGFAHLGVKATSVPYTMNRIYDIVVQQLGI